MDGGGGWGGGTLSYSLSENGDHSVLAVIAREVTQLSGVEMGKSYSSLEFLIPFHQPLPHHPTPDNI